MDTKQPIMPWEIILGTETIVNEFELRKHPKMPIKILSSDKDAWFLSLPILVSLISNYITISREIISYFIMNYYHLDTLNTECWTFFFSALGVVTHAKTKDKGQELSILLFKLLT